MWRSGNLGTKSNKHTLLMTEDSVLGHLIIPRPNEIEKAMENL